MSLQTQTSLLLAAVAALVGQAAELQAVGAVRPEHETKWGALRVGLEQLNEAANAVDQAAGQATPQTPDAAAFEQLGHQVETMALTLDRLADKLDA